MLQAAVRSVTAANVPLGLHRRILVVENDTTKRVDLAELELHCSESERVRPYCRVDYIHQPKLGIASARNTALDYARDKGFDWLAFVDDDETVDLDWLENLIAAANSGAFVLTGGPVTPVLEEVPRTFVQKRIWQGYARQRKRRKAGAERRAAAKEASGITIVTNNWLFDLRAPNTADLRFDTQFDLTGGEDTDFFRRVRNRGAATGWASDAVIFETIPLSRLSIGYQFGRALNQTTVRMMRKTAAFRPLAVRVMLLAVFGTFRLLLGAALILLVVPSFGHTLLVAVRHFGSGVGCFAVLMPNRRAHYLTVTGG